MKEIKKFSEQKLREYVEEYKDIKNSALRRYRSRNEENKMRAYQEHLDAKFMISNIHHKLNHGDWLYDDLPDGSMIGFRKIVASGDKTKIGKLIDGFGRIVDETQSAS